MARKPKKLLKTVTFSYVDEATHAALAKLIDAVEPGTAGARSVAIRRAIINEAARLESGR